MTNEAEKNQIMEVLSMEQMRKELLDLNRIILESTDCYLFVEKSLGNYYVITDIREIQIPKRCKKDPYSIQDGDITYIIISMERYIRL